MLPPGDTPDSVASWPWVEQAIAPPTKSENLGENFILVKNVGLKIQNLGP